MPKRGPMVSTIVNCEWLYNNLNLDKLVLLDASTNREASEDTVFIPNSRGINVKDELCNTNGKFPNTIPELEQFQNQVNKLGVDEDSVVIVYDNEGIYWSPRVWWLFKTFGFKTIAVLDGGLIQWKNLNYPTVNTLAKPNWNYGNFVAKYQPNTIKYFSDILDIEADENHMIIDARSEKRFKCQVSEARVGLRSGTIPNSVNLPYTELIEGSCLKPITELRSLFAKFNVKDKGLTFSCGSGITACILALAAEISGFKNIAVYDGSWTEYATLTS